MFADEITAQRYCQTGETSWAQVVDRVCTIFDCLPDTRNLKHRLRYYMNERKFIPGGRILRNAGLKKAQVSNCFLFSVDDSREGWGDLAKKATVALMTGGGVGVDYGTIRPKGTLLSTTSGIASGPVPLIRSINEIGRGVQCGGFRRSALYASLPWYHQDIFDFIHLKDWPEWLQERKAVDMDVAAPGDMTNISVRLDRQFFAAYYDSSHVLHHHAVRVYWEVVANMVTTGEPGFQVDFDNQILRNACTEIVSADDSDSCVLGAINLANTSLEEMEDVVNLGTAFLLACTQYNTSPTRETQRVQRENRRLGLEVMGVGEWFLQRGLSYGHPDIWPYFEEYKVRSTTAAAEYASTWSLPVPVAVRAIGPTGTISIVAGTTSGIEPLFSAAYERRFLTKQGFESKLLIDPVAKRLHDDGVTILETAHCIPPERRIAFQAEVQSYVDNGISSTVNLPNTWTSPEVFGQTLLHHLPNLRGITAFPNGSRGLQPITPVDFEYALIHAHQYEQQDAACPSGVCSL